MKTKLTKLMILPVIALTAMALTANEPDWGKIVEDQQKSKGHHDHGDHGHHSPVPEPSTAILLGIGIFCAATAISRRQK